MAAVAPSVERTQDVVIRRKVKRRRDWAKWGLATYFVIFLIFLYARYNSDGLDGLLYRLTLAAVVFSIFFLGVAGSYYYFLIEALERKRPDATSFLRTADACFVLGLGLLMLEPALILLTLRILDIGAIAVGLWAISLILIANGRRKFR